jgi:predicted RNA-binding Zn-ribbon protein involved in translation (DUF1610 family)
LQKALARKTIPRVGRTYLFECPKCGYRTKVSGGADRGFQLAVQTILCHDCKELYDAVTSFKVPWPRVAGGAGATIRIKDQPKPLNSAPTFLAAVNRLPLPARTRVRWQHFKIVCPMFPHHRVREWNQPDKCPRCGLFLERNALPFRLWE